MLNRATTSLPNKHETSTPSSPYQPITLPRSHVPSPQKRRTSTLSPPYERSDPMPVSLASVRREPRLRLRQRLPRPSKEVAKDVRGDTQTDSIGITFRWISSNITPSYACKSYDCTLFRLPCVNTVTILQLVLMQRRSPVFYFYPCNAWSVPIPLSRSTLLHCSSPIC